MQDFDEQEMLFLRENIVLEKVDGEIMIGEIETDVGRVWGNVISAVSVGCTNRVGRVGRVGPVGNEENES